MTLPLYPPPFDKGGGDLYQRGEAPLEPPFIAGYFVGLESQREAQTSLFILPPLFEGEGDTGGEVD